MPKAPSKWTVVAAFIVAVALHMGPVAWVETQQAKPTLEASAPVVIRSMEKAFETDGTRPAEATRAAAD